MSSKASGLVTRTSPQLFRDCLRLVQHIAGKSSPKSLKLKSIVRQEFKKHALISDEALIDQLKSNAVKGLANYLMLESSMKDERISKNASNYMKSERESIQPIHPRAET